MPTITDDTKDATGVVDDTPWLFAAVLHGTDNALITSTPVEVSPVDGVLSVELETGPVIVTYRGKTYPIVVGDTDTTLRALLAAVIPAGTDADVLAEVVAAYFEVNPEPPGPQGIQGVKGDKGDTGTAGAQGIQGVKGDTGSTGSAGTAGAQGIQGVKGDTGSTGSAGTAGAQGIQGVKGDTGATGPTGPQGVKGDTGDPGASDATATASTVALRDTNANLVANSFNPGTASTATAGGTTSMSIADKQFQIWTGTLGQTINLPTTGVALGQAYFILNRSTGTLIVQSSAANAIANIAASQGGIFVALQANPTTAAHWQLYQLVSSTISAQASNNAIALRTSVGNLAATNLLQSILQTATSAGTLVMTSASAAIQNFTGVTTHTVTLPTTGVGLGWTYKFINQSTGAITINASGGALVKTLAAGASTEITCTTATPTTAAHWFATA